MLGAMPSDLAAFIARLPKAELHVHHVGSASPRIVSELADAASRHGARATPSALTEFFAFRDFAHFIEVYLAVVDLIRTPEDVRLLTYEIAREMAEEQQVRYAELTCTPFTSVAAGVPDRGLHRGHRGRPGGRRAGPRHRAALDLRHPGESGLPAADATLDYALNHRARRAGRLRARRSRGRRTPAAVQAALRRRPCRRAAQRAARRGDDRAGDGVGRAAPPRRRADRARHLLGPGPRRCWPTSPSTRIPLEVCPSSNIATRAVATLEEHPLRAFRRRGRRGDDQQRRPADVRHHAQPGVRDRRRPARPRRVRRRRARPHRGAGRRSRRTTSRRGSSRRSTRPSTRWTDRRLSLSKPKALEAHTFQGRLLCTTPANPLHGIDTHSAPPRLGG